MNPMKQNLDGRMTVKVNVGGKIVQLLDDDRIAQHIKKGEKFEPNTLEFFGRSVIPGTRVLDIGCYSGLFSIAASKLGALPIGFEPYKPNYQQIELNQRVNETYFLLVNTALSDKDGTAKMGYNEAVHLTSGASLERKSGPKLDVPTQRLDTFMQGFHFDEVGISVIKMDVERHEPAVIRGGRLTIDRYKPIIIAEANDLKARTELLAAMEGLNYRDPIEMDVRNLIFVPN